MNASGIFPEEPEEKVCPVCENRLRYVTKNYKILTKDERRPVVTIENLLFEECTVCTYSEMTEKSMRNVEIVREMIRLSMQQLAEQEIQNLKRIQEKRFNVFKRLIG